MPAIQVVVVTPERTALDERVDFVALPLYDGEKGVAAGHSPMIGRLGFGELRLRSGDQISRYYIDGGFVQVAENVVSVLTNLARPASQIEEAEARQQLDEAQQAKSNSPELMEIRDRKIAQARAKLRVARR